MQTITYTLILPRVGDRVTISDVTNIYTVYQIENIRPPYDSVVIRNNTSGDLSRIVITNGKWQVQYYPVEHTITINNPEIPRRPFHYSENGKMEGNGMLHVERGKYKGDYPFKIAGFSRGGSIRLRFDKDPGYNSIQLDINGIEYDIYDLYVSSRGNETWLPIGYDKLNDGDSIHFDDLN